MEKRYAWLLAGAAVAVAFVNSLLSQILFSAFTVALAITVGIVLCRLIRLRWVVVLALGAALLWPVLHDIRNEGRVAYAPTQFIAQPTANNAAERLRLDKNFALAANFDPPSNLGEPSLAQMVRYGLIPRALDPDPNRATVSTGQLLNAALGGSPNSSFSFTVLGNVEVLAGTFGMLLYMMVVTSAMAFAVRRRGVAGLVFACLLVQHCLWIESTYPDGIGALIQGLTSGAVAFIFLTLLEKLFARRNPAETDGTGRPDSRHDRPTMRRPRPAYMRSGAEFSELPPP
jgi:hypothetical protein